MDDASYEKSNRKMRAKYTKETKRVLGKRQGQYQFLHPRQM